MDDYAMGLFLAAKRKIQELPENKMACLCLALSKVIRDEGGNPMTSQQLLELFPAFAAAYDGNRFWKGKLIEYDYESTGIYACWWYPSRDPIPRIAMIDFLVGK